MNYIDLTHQINEDTSVYPGKNQPVIKKTSSILREGYRETAIYIDSHTGTHIDAPAHMFEEGRYLHNYPLNRFVGKALVINFPIGKRVISIPFLEKYEHKMDNVDFVLFNTGWWKYWGSESYVNNYPVFDEGAVNWLASFFIKGVGIDTISVDPIDSTTWDNHHILFSHDIIIIENLIFPGIVDDFYGEFICLPLSINEADGSPVRAVIRYYSIP